MGAVAAATIVAAGLAGAVTHSTAQRQIKAQRSAQERARALQERNQEIAKKQQSSMQQEQAKAKQRIQDLAMQTDVARQNLESNITDSQLNSKRKKAMNNSLDIPLLG